MRGDVKLKYCKVGDEICSVLEFVHLSQKERPFSICPKCDQPLILKLGLSGKVAHQAAH
jgi:competence CoiA-like predicted nuclease